MRVCIFCHSGHAATTVYNLLRSAILLNVTSSLQVDGFRFDIMSCLMVSTMAKARNALRGLTVEKDGVDGGGMLLYGEGWDFGEVGVPAGC